MKFELCTGLLAASGALAFPSFMSSKRSNSATDAVLYAYGTNISGFPVLYSVSDGLLYVAASNTTSLVSVTWDIPALSSASTTETSATFINGTSLGVLSTGTNDTALSDAQIIKSGSTNGTTTGYTLYGKQLVYYDTSSLQSKFWAKKVLTASTDVWQLLWNNANENESELTPVSLKITGPSTTTS